MKTIDVFNDTRDTMIGSISDFIKSSVTDSKIIVDIESVVIKYNEITINNKLLIFSKIAMRMAKFFKVSIEDLGNRIRKSVLQVVSKDGINVYWITNEFGIVSFLDTNKDQRACGTYYPRDITEDEMIVRNLSNLFGLSVSALSTVTKDFTAPDISNLDKQFILIKHIKTIVKLLQNDELENMNYCTHGTRWIEFNSKLLDLNNNPIYLRAYLSSDKVIECLDVIANVEYKPFYLEPDIDVVYLSGVNAIIQTQTIYHLKRYKYKFIVGVDCGNWVSELTDKVSESLRLSPYMDGIIIPLLYKGNASIGVRVSYGDSYVYCLGDYPTGNRFYIKTILDGYVAHINNRSITSLYSSNS